MSVILEACDYHGPYPGNFIPSLIAVADAAREQHGHQCVHVFPDAVADRPWVQTMREAGYQPRFIGATDAVGRLRALHSVASELHPALVRSHFTRFDLPAGVLARRSGARCVWNVHSGILRHDAREQVASLVKVRLLGAALCDRVIAVSEQIGREARQRGHPADRVTVVPNGIDIARFGPGRMPSRADARRGLGIRDDARVALAFAWTPYRKGADLLVDACRGGDLTLLVVGGEPLREFLWSHCGGPPPDELRIVAPVDDPATLFSAADCFVSASREEAFSYAIGEAMASGLPVVSSDVPGPAAYFAADGVRTFRSEDVDDLRRVLLATLRDAGRDAAGEANGRFVAERLGLDRHVEGVLAVFERELARR